MSLSGHGNCSHYRIMRNSIVLETQGITQPTANIRKC